MNNHFICELYYRIKVTGIHVCREYVTNLIYKLPFIISFIFFGCSIDNVFSTDQTFELADEVVRWVFIKNNIVVAGELCNKLK